MNLPSPADVFAAFFAGGRQPAPEPGMVRYGPCDRSAPDAEYEVWAWQADPEPEAELWTGPEPEAEP